MRKKEEEKTLVSCMHQLTRSITRCRKKSLLMNYLK